MAVRICKFVCLLHCMLIHKPKIFNLQSEWIEVFFARSFCTLGIVLLDQITKLLVKGFSLPFLDFITRECSSTKYSIIGDFLRLTFVENPGMAFDRQSATIVSWPSSLWSQASNFYYIYRVRNEAFIVRLTLAMILAGYREPIDRSL